MGAERLPPPRERLDVRDEADDATALRFLPRGVLDATVTGLEDDRGRPMSSDGMGAAMVVVEDERGWGGTGAMVSAMEDAREGKNPQDALCLSAGGGSAGLDDSEGGTEVSAADLGALVVSALA